MVNCSKKEKKKTGTDLPNLPDLSKANIGIYLIIIETDQLPRKLQ